MFAEKELCAKFGRGRINGAARRVYEMYNNLPVLSSLVCRLAARAVKTAWPIFSISASNDAFSAKDASFGWGINLPDDICGRKPSSSR
jgi:hypothetical protein